MAQKAIKKIGNYRLYRVDGWAHYEIYLGTKADGIHVENISDPENFQWAIDTIERNISKEIEYEFDLTTTREAI